jgi:hypothetical protein
LRTVPLQDLTNQRFGKLVVIQEAARKRTKGKNESKRRWLCRCDCGKEKIISHSSLKGGLTISCTCYQKEQITKALQKEPYWVPYARLVRDAKKRHISVNLSFEEYQNFAQKNFVCHYCSFPLVWCKHSTNDTSRGHNLDRKDSSKGYSVENCVPCCKGCNESKLLRCYEEWVLVGKAIREYRESREEKIERQESV